MKYCEENFISFANMKTIEGIKNQLYSDLSKHGFSPAVWNRNERNEVLFFLLFFPFPFSFLSFSLFSLPFSFLKSETKLEMKSKTKRENRR